MDLKHASIPITGAGSGIGQVLALQVADHQTRPTSVGGRQQRLAGVADPFRARGAQARVADLTGPGAPERAVASARAECDGVDVLGNDPGNVRAGRLEAIEETEVVAPVAFDLIAPILLTRATLSSLRESERGLVINTSSGIGPVALPFHATRKPSWEKTVDARSRI